MRQAIDVCNAQQGHEAANTLFKRYVKPQTLKGARGRLIWEPIDISYRHQLRKAFHGPVLTDFSEQVWVRDPETGQRVRYAPPVWKQHLKNLFCPARFDADGKELPRSTEALSDDEFADFLLACQAYGCIDLGIRFTEQESDA
jgi:hypothetical protein